MVSKNTTYLIIATTILAIVALVYLIGASFTGFVTQTMYCEDGICKKFCNFDTDCSSDNVCCTKGDFGVCEDKAVCEGGYALSPKGNYVGEAAEARLENPLDVDIKYLIPVYVLLVAFLVAFVLYYFLRHKKKVKKVVKSKVVRKRVVKKKSSRRKSKKK